jgi:hypothetical protein
MTEDRCRCGFPLDKDHRICIACLPAQFRQVVGRYNFSIDETIMKDSSVS